MNQAVVTNTVQFLRLCWWMASLFNVLSLCNEICEWHTEETEQAGKLYQALVSRACYWLTFMLEWSRTRANAAFKQCRQSGRYRNTSRYSDLGVFDYSEIVQTLWSHCWNSLDKMLLLCYLERCVKGALCKQVSVYIQCYSPALCVSLTSNKCVGHIFPFWILHCSHVVLTSSHSSSSLPLLTVAAFLGVLGPPVDQLNSLKPLAGMHTASRPLVHAREQTKRGPSHIDPHPCKRSNRISFNEWNQIQTMYTVAPF